MSDSILNRQEVYEDCIRQASDMVRLLVEDFDKKYTYEPLVRSITLHLASLYYLIQTNENFQFERERMAFQAQQLLEGLKTYKGE